MLHLPTSAAAFGGSAVLPPGRPTRRPAACRTANGAGGTGAPSERPHARRQAALPARRQRDDPGSGAGRLRSEGYPEHMLDAYMTGERCRPPARRRATASSAPWPRSTSGGQHRGDRAPSGSRTDRPPTPAAVTEAPTDTTGRTIYGLSMFRQKTSMFDPSAAGPGGRVVRARSRRPAGAHPHG
jgi:hypothetical protein